MIGPIFILINKQTDTYKDAQRYRRRERERHKRTIEGDRRESMPSTDRKWKEKRETIETAYLLQKRVLQNST